MNYPLWPVFYEAFADSVLAWDQRRQELFDLIRRVASKTRLMDYLKLDNPEFWEERDYEIDPFTVTAIFNRGTTAAHRRELARILATALGMGDAEPPADFHGVPHLDPRHAIYADGREIWTLATLARREKPLDDAFLASWDRAIDLKGNGLGMLTIALFWFNPNVFMALDKMSDPYIEAHYGLTPPKEKCEGRVYENFLLELKAKTPNLTFPQITLAAWNAANDPQKETKEPEQKPDDEKKGEAD